MDWRRNPAAHLRAGPPRRPKVLGAHRGALLPDLAHAGKRRCFPTPTLMVAGHLYFRMTVTIAQRDGGIRCGGVCPRGRRSMASSVRLAWRRHMTDIRPVHRPSRHQVLLLRCSRATGTPQEGTRATRPRPRPGYITLTYFLRRCFGARSARDMWQQVFCAHWRTGAPSPEGGTRSPHAPLRLHRWSALGLDRRGGHPAEITHGTGAGFHLAAGGRRAISDPAHRPGRGFLLARPVRRKASPRAPRRPVPPATSADLCSVLLVTAMRVRGVPGVSDAFRPWHRVYGPWSGALVPIVNALLPASSPGGASAASSPGYRR